MKKITVKLKKALNPASKHSGIFYEEAALISNAFTRNYSSIKTEAMDDGVTESIKKAYRSKLGLFSGVKATYDIIVGRHYTAPALGETNQDNIDPQSPQTNAKGILDYSILPLLSRALLYQFESERRTGRYACSTTLAGPLVLGVEISRFCIGSALTLALFPFVASTHLVRSLSEDKPSNKHRPT